jgi:hypothetical protein
MQKLPDYYIRNEDMFEYHMFISRSAAFSLLKPHVYANVELKFDREGMQVNSKEMHKMSNFL